MNEKSLKNIEDAMNDCLDKASVCEYDSEDLYKLLDEAKALGAILNENEKIKAEAAIEEKKIESWKSPKFWIPLVASFATTAFTLAYNRKTLQMQTRDMCNFEKNSTWTYSASKGLGSTLRMPQLVKGA